MTIDFGKDYPITRDSLVNIIKSAHAVADSMGGTAYQREVRLGPLQALELCKLAPKEIGEELSNSLMRSGFDEARRIFGTLFTQVNSLNTILINFTVTKPQ